MSQVVLDGLRAQEQRGGRLARGLAGRKEPRDLQLLRRELRRARGSRRRAVSPVAASSRGRPPPTAPHRARRTRPAPPQLAAGRARLAHAAAGRRRRAASAPSRTDPGSARAVAALPRSARPARRRRPAAPDNAPPGRATTAGPCAAPGARTCRRRPRLVAMRRAAGSLDQLGGRGHVDVLDPELLRRTSSACEVPRRPHQVARGQLELAERMHAQVSKSPMPRFGAQHECLGRVVTGLLLAALACLEPGQARKGRRGLRQLPCLASEPDGFVDTRPRPRTIGWSRHGRARAVEQGGHDPERDVPARRSQSPLSISDRPTPASRSHRGPMTIHESSRGSLPRVGNLLGMSTPLRIATMPRSASPARTRRHPAAVLTRNRAAPRRAAAQPERGVRRRASARARRRRRPRRPPRRASRRRVPGRIPPHVRRRRPARVALHDRARGARPCGRGGARSARASAPGPGARLADQRPPPDRRGRRATQPRPRRTEGPGAGRPSAASRAARSKPAAAVRRRCAPVPGSAGLSSAAEAAGSGPSRRGGQVPGPAVDVHGRAGRRRVRGGPRGAARRRRRCRRADRTSGWRNSTRPPQGPRARPARRPQGSASSSPSAPAARSSAARSPVVAGRGEDERPPGPRGERVGAAQERAGDRGSGPGPAAPSVHVPARRPRGESSSRASGLPAVAWWSRSAAPARPPPSSTRGAQGRARRRAASADRRRRAARLVARAPRGRPRWGRRGAGGCAKQQRLGARPSSQWASSTRTSSGAFGVGGEQAQRRGPDREAILGRAGPQRERALEARPAGRDAVKQLRAPAAEARAAGERDVRLGLDTARAKHPHAGPRVPRHSRATPSCRFPARRRSASTALRPDARQRSNAPLDLTPLAVAAHQHGAILGRPALIQSGPHALRTRCVPGRERPAPVPCATQRKSRAPARRQQ